MGWTKKSNGPWTKTRNKHTVATCDNSRDSNKFCFLLGVRAFEIENIESQKIEVAAPAVDVQALLRDTLEKESTSHAVAQCGLHASKMIRTGSLKKKSPAVRSPNEDSTLQK